MKGLLSKLGLALAFVALSALSLVPQTDARIGHWGISTFVAPASGGALMLYTDITDGPISGGESSKGTYLSAFFVVPGGYTGTFSDWGVTSHLDLCNGSSCAEVDNYRYLEKAVGNHTYGLGNTGEGVGEYMNVWQIRAQVGALSAISPTMGTALSVKLIVNGQSPLNSTSGTNNYLDLNGNALAFTPINGTIYFVSLSGTDQAGFGTGPTGSQGTFAAPLRHIQSYNAAACGGSGCFGGAIWGQVSGVTTANIVLPGTQVIVMPGEYGADQSFDASTADFFRKTGLAPGSGAAGTSGSLVVMSYPGTAGSNVPARVTINTLAGSAGGFNFSDSARSVETTVFGTTGWCHYITLANMQIAGPTSTFSTSGAAGSPVNWQYSAMFGRIVNLDLSFHPTAGGPTAGGNAGFGSNSFRGGNFVHDIEDPSGSQQNHCIYIGNNPTNGAASGELSSETEYNFMIRCNGGQGVMVRGAYQTEVSPYLTIAYNYIGHIAKFGIEFFDDRDRAMAYDNIIQGATFTDSGTTGTQACFAANSDNLAVLNALYYGYNTCVGPVGHYALFYQSGAANGGSSILLEGNIMYNLSNTGNNTALCSGQWLICNQTAETITASGNDWLDVNGSMPPTDTLGQFVNPLLTNTAALPMNALPTGSSTMPNHAPTPPTFSLPAYDFFFNTRPATGNTKWAIGAVE